VAIGIFSLRNLNEMQRESGWVSHTLEVLSEVRLLSLIVPCGRHTTGVRLSPALHSI